MTEIPYSDWLNKELNTFQARPSEKTWGSMYAIGRLEIEEDGSANMEIINNTILEYNLAEGKSGVELRVCVFVHFLVNSFL